MKKTFPRPKLFVSRCLGFDACRYNGLKIIDRSVELLKSHADIVTACPELAIGLGVPRKPIRVVEEEGRRMLYQPATENDYAAAMETWLGDYLDALGPVDGFILKAKSPSCGPWGVKLFTNRYQPGTSKIGTGFFGGEVVHRFIGCPIEEEGRLRNFTIREHFLTFLFTLASFRESVLRPGAGAKDLVRFHTTNKLLFLAYNQRIMREMGKLVARAGSESFDRLTEEYRVSLGRLFSKPPKPNAMINAFEHAFGGLSDKLSPSERSFFIDTLEEYRDERIPVSTIVHLLVGWALRFGNDYLLEQSLIAPFPSDLVEITDSGKGRNR
ncbi:YbgA family protein [Sediminispirochaeta bajacaliforniensis]|uniref:YbgA family protein n=1 Tax=Sediminispirochaeta bajacaliforniensis TaxID=148 RepID=UPI00037A0A0C|nr:DUF523 and DUF1722 domain-containing protein [Sediminispirochaeta bajacaliforniensis]